MVPEEKNDWFLPEAIGIYDLFALNIAVAAFLYECKS